MTPRDNPGKDFLIVGIGASAGGLEAFRRFLNVLPRNFDFALVFVQHLSSKHKSLLQELLSARRPSLVIQEISDGLKAQPGRLYLSPPGKEVRLRNGLFQTTVHPEGLIHLPIDEFFASLADDAGDRSIAVIFSGAGTDGARGCQAIRFAGGTVFVQDPATTDFSSMPIAAIATGQADAVLSPEDICREILKLQGIGTPVVNREQPMTPEEFEAFFRLLQEKTGSRFNHYKKSVISRRIRRRMYLHGISVVRGYLDLISSNDAEAAHLASDLMIGVTSFFRDRVAWKALNLEAVRKIVAENTDLPVRVWTPASATGEEAYSIAMMLLRELDLAGKKRDVQVFATDVNDRALERAREGKYPASIAVDVPQEYVQKYFTSGDDGNCLIINKDVRESVVFAKQDLLTDPPFSRLDLIICRNFMIYLEPEAQEKSIKLFHYALKEGGFLFLGNAETVGRNSRLFQSMGRKQCRIYRKLETKPASRLPLSVPYATERLAPPARQAQIAEQGRSATEIIQEKLLEEYAPASVAIDQNYQIVYHNGPTNRYLRQPRGVPTQNLLELLPENLRSRIRGAIYRSSRENRPVAIRTSVAGDDNRKRQVSLRIAKARENVYIVVFLEKGINATEEAEQVDASVIEETAIHQLEGELSATRADLQSHIEQLKSLNEELQSSNEELQAANEELETSREELQSLNEELITVNSQLQGKIEEQDVTNSDLNNFLASTNIPTIFLDQQFRLKRSTPAMSRLIMLIPSDVGRPIIDMSQENLGPELIADAQTVLETLVPITKEIRINGTWYVRTALPYRTADNRIEGVVITYNDVTELKQAEERTRHLASFPQLNPNPVIEVDASGNILFANPGTENVLESLGMDTEDATVFLPKDLDVILEDLGKNSASSVSRTVSVKDRVFSETVYLAPQFKVARIYAYDITEHKQAEEALRESEEQFRTLADSIPNLAWWANADGYITWYNRRWYEYTGTTPEQMEGWGWQSVHDPLVLPKVLERWKASIATGQPFDMEFPLRGADGIFRSFLTRVLPLKDAAGTVLRWFGTNTDISALKQAEDALRESEAKYRSLFDNMIDGFAYHQIILDESGVPVDYAFLEVNNAFERLTGLKRGDIVGRSAREALPGIENDPADWIGTYGRVALTGRETRFEQYSASLGKWYSVAAYSPVKEYFVTIFEDITERKRAEEALRQSEERLNRSQEIAHLGSWELDLVNDRLFWSDEVYRIFGLNPQEFGATYEAFLEAVHPDDREAVNAAYSGSLREGRDTYDIEHRVVRKATGEVRIVHEKCEHFRDGSGRIIRSVGMVHDITERRRAEKDVLKLSEDMAARNVELETLNNELEAFIYSVSHDLRAPLRSVSEFARIVAEDYADRLDEQGIDYLSRVSKGSAKMSRLIEDLLYLSRISRQDLVRTNVDMSKTASEIVAELREAHQGRNVEVEIKPGLDANADPRLMEVALSNLFGNAWKFTSKTENARIEFGTVEKEGKTVYYVRDNGAGFDQNYAEKMFWPFQRLHTEQEFAGTGIGLTIVERVIRRQGGRVWAEGECGKGATVYFTLG